MRTTDDDPRKKAEPDDTRPGAAAPPGVELSGLEPANVEAAEGFSVDPAVDPTPGPGPDPEIEPAVDPDSRKHLSKELLDPPHAASRFDAGAGQGTVHGMPKGTKFQERPILDGSTQSLRAEATVPNPNRGQQDPALVTHQPALNTSSTNRWLKWAVVAAAVMSLVLLLLAPWNPMWCGIGVIVALSGVLAMLVIRLTRIRTSLRLRIDAVIMALVWLIPLAIFIGVLATSADEIW